MTTSSKLPNKLLYGDNLEMLERHVPDESVDLCYLDPPFKSDADYNLLFKEKDGRQSSAQIKAFGDTWSWGLETERDFHRLTQNAPQRLSALMQALRETLRPNDMLAYLTMMASRLVELHRVLKETGSLYLHCDPTASHYLKLILDAIFGPQNFINEVIWKRSHAHNSGRMFGPVHDVILLYAKSPRYTWNPQYRPLDQSYIDSHYSYVEGGRRYKRQDLTGAGVRHGETGQPWRGIDPTPKGRHWMRPPADLDKLDAEGRVYWPAKPGAWPYLKLFLDERPGMLVQDVWDDIDPVNPVAKERLGYPTQKPLALLERIIRAGSNEGDVVLDPFCGCGTSITVAERLKRRWIGIDVTHLAISIMRQRLSDTFGKDLSPYEVIGEPTDVSGAQALAGQDRYQFQWWVVGKLGVRPAQDKKKGADSGIDGYHYFYDGGSQKPEKLIVQVKSGHVKVGDVRDLIGTMTREKAAIAAFVTLEPPTKPMLKEAAGAGFYTSAWTASRQFPRLQILTVEEILAGKKIEFPPFTEPVYKKAVRQAKGGPEQGGLFGERLAG
jgi:DNA modification methylase